jgi:acetylglutamate kinase
VKSAVLKIGGELVFPGKLAQLAAEVREVADAGTRVAIVHGGGPQATELQKRLGLEPVIIAGRRVTDEATLDVMKMALAGRVNVDLCGALCAAGVRAVGLHGASANAIRARHRPPRVVPGAGNQPIDLGLVGDVIGFNTALLELLWANGYVPVLASLGADDAGQALNINADTVAAGLAVSLRADALVLVTGVPGVLRDPNDPRSRIPMLKASEARALTQNGTAKGGMLVKLDEAIAAIEEGITSVIVVGELSHGDLKRSLLDPGSVGTVIVR